MTVNNNLKSLRTELKLSQDEMAHEIGMSKNGYGKLERDESDIKIKHLEQIAQTFNIKMEDLVKEGVDFSVVLGNNSSKFNDINVRENSVGRDMNLNHNQNNYYNDQQEIEKLQLVIAHKDELLSQKNEIIAQKDKEIELLRKLLDKA